MESILYAWELQWGYAVRFSCPKEGGEEAVFSVREGRIGRRVIDGEWTMSTTYPCLLQGST